MISENDINMHDLWQSQYFCHVSALLDISPLILWRFIRFVTNQPIILWHSFKFITDEQPFVTFYWIHHGWRTNSPVSMDPPVIYCLRGMNISCWSHMSDWHQNIITCHLGPCVGLAYMSAWAKFYFKKIKMLKMGVEPRTSRLWLPLGF
jgi:hypothetical protein